MRTNLAVLYSIILLIVISDVTSAFENPQYITGHYDRAFKTWDTLATIYYSNMPELYKTTTINIEFISPFESPEGITFTLYGRQVCNCDWDASEKVWPDTVYRGDTVNVDFTFTPLAVGIHNVEVIADNDKSHLRSRKAVPLKIVIPIDEYGKTFKGDVEGNANYGILGLRPKAMMDSLVFVMECPSYYTIKANGDASSAFAARATLIHPFANGNESILRYQITPLHDYDYGVEYQLSIDSNFSLGDFFGEGWDWYVPRGKKLYLDIPVKPISYGIGMFGITLYGFKEGDSTADRTLDGKGMSTSSMYLYFALDETLSLVAYSSTHSIAGIIRDPGFPIEFSKSGQIRLERLSKLLSSEPKKPRRIMSRYLMGKLNRQHRY
jgi:hypothetical protein